MAYRIAINGYGRIGQCVLRALFEEQRAEQQRATRQRGRAIGESAASLEIVAINELSDLDTIAYLTRYDTTHGRFPGEVEARDGRLIIDGHPIRVLSEPDPDRLPWRELGIDLVLECSGSFKDRATAERHLAAGAGRLLFSQPAESDVDATIVTGINDADLAPSHRIVSAASCTTNCLVPVLTVLDEALGIEHGVTTTIHSAMNDQPVIDAYHQTDLRLTRSAMHSIVPVDTGLAAWNASMCGCRPSTSPSWISPSRCSATPAPPRSTPCSPKRAAAAWPACSATPRSRWPRPTSTTIRAPVSWTPPSPGGRRPP